MEAEIIPMCEDQQMAIVPWAALGAGQLMSAEQREAAAKDKDARQGRGVSETVIRVSEALEKIADAKRTTIQAIVSPYSRNISRKFS